MYCRSRDYIICALVISQPLITRSQFIYGYRTKHRQIVGMPHRKLHTSETPFRCSHTFSFFIAQLTALLCYFRCFVWSHSLDLTPQVWLLHYTSVLYRWAFRGVQACGCSRAGILLSYAGIRHYALLNLKH